MCIRVKVISDYYILQFKRVVINIVNLFVIILKKKKGKKKDLLKFESCLHLSIEIEMLYLEKSLICQAHETCLSQTSEPHMCGAHLLVRGKSHAPSA